MNVIGIGSWEFRGPSGWDELTPRQFHQVMNWRVRLGSDLAGRIVLLNLWYKIKPEHWRLLSADQRVDLLQVLDFLDLRPDRWMLPIVSLNGRRYIGPGDGLDFLTFAEFMYAQSARERYLNSGSEQELSSLAAAIYRPRALFFQKKGEAGRQLFDFRTHAEQARTMARLPLETLQGILMNYEGCLDRFPGQFTHLFNARTEASDGGNWVKVGLSLARQTGALGTFEQLERTNLFLVLTTLDDLMKEHNDLKEKLD